MENFILVNDATGLKDEDIQMLRETFVIEYSKKKGWNHKKLSVEQLLEIQSQKGYKTPGMLLS
jgi:hypothetical protein